MSGYYQFSIKYKGKKASHIYPGVTGHDEVCQQFKQELTELGVSLPKAENIHIPTPGSISLLFHRDADCKDSNVRYQRYLAVASTKNANPHFRGLKKKHFMDSLSLSGPSISPAEFITTNNTNSDLSLKLPPKPTPTTPDMSNEYRFTITYKAEKAARLIPGNISAEEVRSIFKADLDAFKIDQPADEVVRLDRPGSVSFTFAKKEDDHVYESCMMLEFMQNKNSEIASLKENLSIHLISLAAESKGLLSKTQDPRKRAQQPAGLDRHNTGLTTPQISSSTTEQRSAKRIRYDSFGTESFKPGQVVHSSTTATTLGPLVSQTNAAIVKSSEPPKCAPPTSIALNETSTLAAISVPRSRSPLPSPRSRVSHRPTYLSTQFLKKASKVNRLCDELWDTRKEISAAQEREWRLEREIEKLTGSRVSQPGAKGPNEERNRRVDLEIRMHRLYLNIALEQESRAYAEQKLKDVERECREPFVVPALLKAFLKISQLSNAAVDGRNNGR